MPRNNQHDATPRSSSPAPRGSASSSSLSATPRSSSSAPRGSASSSSSSATPRSSSSAPRGSASSSSSSATPRGSRSKAQGKRSGEQLISPCKHARTTPLMNEAVGGVIDPNDPKTRQALGPKVWKIGEGILNCVDTLNEKQKKALALHVTQGQNLQEMGAVQAELNERARDCMRENVQGRLRQARKIEELMEERKKNERIQKEMEKHNGMLVESEKKAQATLKALEETVRNADAKVEAGLDRKQQDAASQKELDQALKDLMVAREAQTAAESKLADCQRKLKDFEARLKEAKKATTQSGDQLVELLQTREGKMMIEEQVLVGRQALQTRLAAGENMFYHFNMIKFTKQQYNKAALVFVGDGTRLHIHISEEQKNDLATGRPWAAGPVRQGRGHDIVETIIAYNGLAPGFAGFAKLLDGRDGNVDETRAFIASEIVAMAGLESTKAFDKIVAVLEKMERDSEATGYIKDDPAHA